MAAIAGDPWLRDEVLVLDIGFDAARLEGKVRQGHGTRPRPENFKAYVAACSRGELKPGRMFVFEPQTA